MSRGNGRTRFDQVLWDKMVSESKCDEGANYMPTPDQIAASCAAIRAGWPPATEDARRVQHTPKTEIPIVRQDVHRRLKPAQQ